MADTAVELLSINRTLTTAAIAQVVVERGQTRSRDPLAAVRGALDHDLRLDRLDGGVWTMPSHLLDGAILTHELTEAEAMAGALALDPDMTPLWRALMVLSRIRGSELRLRTREDAAALLGPQVHRAIEGPTGWLPSTPGAFLHLRLASGRLSVTEGPRPDPAAVRVAEERLVASVRHCLEHDLPRYDAPGAEDITHGVLQALADVPGILDQALTPLGTLFRSAGLEVVGMEVGLPGTDWESRFWPRMSARDVADRAWA